MIFDLQRKAMKTGMEWTEKSLENLYKDKTFLQLSSIGLNVNLWMQKSYGRGLGWLFNNMNIPNLDNITHLHQSLHELEVQNHDYEDRIKILEATIEKLQEELSAQKKKRSTASRSSLKRKPAMLDA